MKKKIAILGSTGSIGTSTLNIIKKDKKNFEIVLLSTKNNFNKVFKQAIEFKVKNVVIKNNIYGMQCHPEKSHNNGEIFLENFCNLNA